MITITLLLLAAALAWTLARAFNLPAVATLLLMGIGLNAIGLRDVAAIDPEVANDAFLLGLTFLVFHSGTELSPGRIGRRGATAVQIGIIQFLVLGALGMGLAYLLGRSVTVALYFGLAIAVSSTLVVVRLLQQRRQFFEPFAQLLVGVLLVQDVILLVAIALIEGSQQRVQGLQGALGGLVVLVAMTLVFLRWLSPWLLLRRKQDDETLLLILLSVLFLFLGLAYQLDLPLVVGAFTAGVSVSAFPVHGLVRGQLNTLTNFFMALFFVSLGFFVPIPQLSAWPTVLGLCALVLLVTPPLVAWIAERAGMSARGALESGLLLAQTSEFSIIVGVVGVASGVLSLDDLGLLTMVTLLTMLATPFFTHRVIIETLIRWHPSTRMADPLPKSGHVLMAGCGELGFTMLDLLEQSQHDVVVIEDDPGIVAKLKARGVTVIRGDAASATVLARASATQALAIISVLRRVEDSVSLLNRVGGVPTYVRVFEDADAQRIADAGGFPVAYAAATAERFGHWFCGSMTGDCKDPGLPPEAP